MAKTLEEAMDDDIAITFKVSDLGVLLEAIQFRMAMAKHFIDMADAPPPLPNVAPIVDNKIMFEVLVHTALGIVGKKLIAPLDQYDVSS